MKVPLQSRQRGGISVSSRAWTSTRGSRPPQSRQTTWLPLPCSSITVRLPAAACRPSVFWVTTADTWPASSMAAMA